MMHRKIPQALVASLLFSAAALAQEGRLLHELFSPGSGGTIAYGSYGRSVCTIGDVDGDGWDDIAVGHPDSIGAQTSGRVQFVSGQTGAPILDCFAPGVGSVGMAVASAGSVDGDLIPDVIAIGSNAIVVFSGSTGAVIWQFAASATGIATAWDWNGDSYTDLAYIASGNLYVLSGINNSTTMVAAATEVVSVREGAGSGDRRLATLSAGTVTLHDFGAPPVWSVSGFSKIAAAGDTNGDGYEDVLAMSLSTVHVLSGIDGAVLFSTPVTGNGALAGGVDFDGDSLADFVIGDTSGRGFVRAYSSFQGSLLFTREGQEVGESFGSALAVHPGASASSRPAVLIGVQYQFSGSEEHGALQIVAKDLPGEFDGSFRPFGPICNYTQTFMRPGGSRPTVGQNYGFRFVSNSQTTGFTLLAYGFSNTSWFGVPLPVVVPSPLSCQVLVSPDVLIPHSMSSYANLAIPANAALSGFTLYVQGWNLLGYPVLEASNAATIVIGN